MSGSIPPIAQSRTIPVATDHWLAVLRAHIRLVRAEIRAELSSGHPGSRHRMAHLIARAANIDGQILAAERRS